MRPPAASAGSARASRRGAKAAERHAGLVMVPRSRWRIISPQKKPLPRAKVAPATATAQGQRVNHPVLRTSRTVIAPARSNNQASTGTIEAITEEMEAIREGIEGIRTVSWSIRIKTRSIRGTIWSIRIKTWSIRGTIRSIRIKTQSITGTIRSIRITTQSIREPIEATRITTQAFASAGRGIRSAIQAIARAARSRAGNARPRPRTPVPPVHRPVRLEAQRARVGGGCRWCAALRQTPPASPPWGDGHTPTAKRGRWHTASGTRRVAHDGGTAPPCGLREAYGHPASKALPKHRKSKMSHTPRPVLVSQSQAYGSFVENALPKHRKSKISRTPTPVDGSQSG